METTLVAVFCLFASVGSQELRASVLFNQGGITGWITFRQQQGSDAILIQTNVQSERPVGGWHVHNFPVDFTIDPAERCAGAGGHYDPSNRFGAAVNYTINCSQSTPLQCEAGDLSGKLGCLVTTTAANVVSYTTTDNELQLQGRYGIIGRSVVIHDPLGGRLACGNIVIEDDNPNILVATFVSPIAGSIYFRQSTTRPEVGTFIFANLYYVNGAASITRNHNWHIHVNQPDFNYVMGNCSEIGPHYNPLGVDVGDPNYATYCNPANISSCEVGDLSNKLGTIDIATDPGSPNYAAWNDANLHRYDIAGRSVAVHAAERGSPIIACAPLIPFSSLQASAYRPPNPSLFSLTQPSPFDPTLVTATVNLSADAYQINRDGNIRADDDRMCYSNMVFSPFDVTPGVSTEDGFALGDVSGKYGASFTEGQNFKSDYFPLYNRYSTLGHNFMVDESGSVTCGTINPSGSIRVVQAWVNFTNPMVNGWITFRQILTWQNDGSYSTGPTLVNYRFSYEGAAQTDGHNWHVHSERTGTDGPTSSCDVIQGHYNPYGVNLMTNYPQLCDPTGVTRYPLRCEVGDLSGKHGRLSIRASDSPERTLVFYDPNLPLVGPYTILGRSIAVHNSNGEAPIMACSNIEPAVLSNTSLRLSFPDLPSDAMDPRITLPVAIVNLINNTNVMHGEVLVYNVDVTAATAANGTVGCTIVTLRFTEFTGDGSPEETIRLVQGLNQDDLPPQYRTGACQSLDLTGIGTPPTPKAIPDSGVNAKPLSFFIGAFVAVVLLTYYIIV